MILASKSPRRKEILEKIGFNIKILVEEVIEESEQDKIEEKIKEISYKKVIEIAKKNPNEYIVGADTVVVIENEILGKPKDREDAKKMIKKLSGKRHEVITAFSFLNLEKNIKITECVKSEVIFKDITCEELDWYLSTNDYKDKAGGYGIQGKAAIFIEKINGDYYSIMGFPLEKFIDCLKKIGISIEKLKEI